MTGETNHQLPQVCLSPMLLTSVYTSGNVYFAVMFNTKCSTELTKIRV